MTLFVLGEAEQEFAESVAYYESKEPGLGWRFRNEVRELFHSLGRSRSPGMRFRPVAKTALEMGSSFQYHRGVWTKFFISAVGP